MPADADSKKIRADELLLSLSLVESRTKGQALIMAGEVEVFDSKKDQWSELKKAGQQLKKDTPLRLKTNKEQYVGRGAYKLLQAFDRWDAFRVQGHYCMDIGSSTGGFTQVLLEKGASKVIALDVGTNQLHEKMRADKRVVSIEKQHILKTDAAFWKSHSLEPSFDTYVSDLSFISLKKVIPHVWPWLKSGGSWLMLVKPQFELEKSKVPKGVVKNSDHRYEALKSVVDVVELCQGANVVGHEDSQTKGAEGNVEYLLWVQKES